MAVLPLLVLLSTTMGSKTSKKQTKRSERFASGFTAAKLLSSCLCLACLQWRFALCVHGEADG
jgi:hypothetical protein